MNNNVERAPEFTEVIIVGAGFAGIGAAIKLRQEGIEFVVLEKAVEMGGVWRDNHYPDCGCDVPSALYSYSFAPKFDWSHFFAKQEEIKQYTVDTATKFGILPSIKFEHEALSIRWIAEPGCWEISTVKGVFRCNYVVMASGPMHTPVLPQIKGLETFSGTTFHSARWNHDYDLTGKRVAVIGTGASAVQFLPEIVDKTSALTLFQRTAPWILPKMDVRISKTWQSRFKRFPFLLRMLRRAVYCQFELLNSSLKFPFLIKRLEAVGISNIHRGVKDPVLREKLTPDFSIGCKRILMSNTWYRALAKDNVQVVGSVAEISGDTVISHDGSVCQVDAIIFATGFEVSNPPIAERIYNKEGMALSEQWQGSPVGYYGTTVEKCPNLFLTLGPNLYTFSSAFVMIEAQLNYILSAITTMRKRQLKTLEINSDTNRHYNIRLQSALQKTVWNIGGCTSYFIDKNGLNSTNWPWTTFYMRRKLGKFEIRDYCVSE